MVVLQKIKATGPACFFSCSKTKTPPFVTRGRHCCLVFGALAVFLRSNPLTPFISAAYTGRLGKIHCVPAAAHSSSSRISAAVQLRALLFLR